VQPQKDRNSARVLTGKSALFLENPVEKVRVSARSVIPSATPEITRHTARADLIKKKVKTTATMAIATNVLTLHSAIREQLVHQTHVEVVRSAKMANAAHQMPIAPTMANATPTKALAAMGLRSCNVTMAPGPRFGPVKQGRAVKKGSVSLQKSLYRKFLEHQRHTQNNQKGQRRT